MRRPEQEPEVTEIVDGHQQGAKRYRHPAYGQIGASRCQGGHLALYGSDFRHNSSITITICESEFTRNLSRDWPHAKRQLIEVTLSEAQWATFVSSLNCGEGVQCTLDYVMGEAKPRIAFRDAAAEHHAEVAETIRDGLAEIAKAREALEALGLSKAKLSSVLAPLTRAEMELTSNAAFVVDSHSKAMEERVEKAKIEVNAYVTGAVMRAGLASIQQGDPVVSLPAPSKPSDQD